MNNSSRAIVNEQGLGLISAIFVLSVLALIAAGMASLVANSANNHSQQLLSIRAQSAALSALNIEMVKMADSQSCLTEQRILKFTTPGLFDCTAQVGCSSVEYQQQHFIHLTSEGSCGAGADMAVRFEQKRILK